MIDNVKEWVHAKIVKDTQIYGHIRFYCEHKGWKIRVMWFIQEVRIKIERANRRNFVQVIVTKRKSANYMQY